MKAEVTSGDTCVRDDALGSDVVDNVGRTLPDPDPDRRAALEEDLLDGGAHEHLAAAAALNHRDQVQGELGGAADGIVAAHLQVMVVDGRLHREPGPAVVHNIACTLDTGWSIRSGATVC